MIFFQFLKKLFNGLAVFILCMVITLFVVNLLSSAGVHFLKKYEGDAQGDAILMAELPLYEGKDWAEECWEDLKQFKMDVEAFTCYRGAPLKTKYVNIGPDGIRKTAKNPNPGAKRIFLFGGSTMWGWGGPDDMTIPSCLQSLLGPDYDVYNMAQPGYYSAQELSLLLRELADNNIPDVVIFMDGQNDAELGAYVGNPRWTKEPPKYYVTGKRGPRMVRVLKELYQGSHIQRLVQEIQKIQARKQSQKDPHQAASEAALPENAQLTVQYYEKVVEAVKALGQWYGFKTYFFWQPVLLKDLRNPQPYEQDYLDKVNPYKVKAFEATWAAAEERLSGRESENIYYIADLFKNTDIPIYMDMGHTEYNGNMILAEKMYQVLKETNAAE